MYKGETERSEAEAVGIHCTRAKSASGIRQVPYIPRALDKNVQTTPSMQCEIK